MSRISLLVVALAVTFAVVSVSSRPITGIDGNGQRLRQFIVVLSPTSNMIPFTRSERDTFVASRLPSVHLFNTRQDGQHIYDAPGFVGFSAMLTSEELSILSNDVNVAYIEEDQVIQLDRPFPREVNDIDVPTWGDDRSDQRALPLNHIYKLPITKEEAVAIPNVYVVDTGINPRHNEFQGRAQMLADFVKDGETEDCNGHGTHVAGTVGGYRVGIAPFANIFGVRVLDCDGSGSYAGVIGGINFVTKNATKPAVLTMSLGGGFSKAINDAVVAAINSGITVTVASGNEEQDACRVSPASAPGAITVNSLNDQDEASYFSNFGKCTVLYAPGEDVVSAWYNAVDAYKSISGTSMATPHVAGAAALFLARKPNATPKQIKDAIVCSATPKVVSGVPSNTPNLLLYLEKATMEKCLP